MTKKKSKEKKPIITQRQMEIIGWTIEQALASIDFSKEWIECQKKNK